MAASNYSITAAEVIEVLYTENNPNLLYGLRVTAIGGPGVQDTSSASSFTVKPLNTNVIRVPIIGEVVLIVGAPSSFSSGLINSTAQYYIDIVSLQSSIHHNCLPALTKTSVQNSKASGNANQYNETSAGNTNKVVATTIDSDFKENESVRPLQPYIGDVIFSGRYGQTLRFSTTPKSGKFSVQPKWSGASNDTPITIIRNTRQTKPLTKINQFETEDFTKDDNIVVMSSGQNLEFEQSTKVNSASQAARITSWKDERWGKTPQTLISSGRIVFNSTQKEIIAFAKNGIALASETSIAIDARKDVIVNGGSIRLGTNSQEPLILGNAFDSWMNQLLTAIGSITPISPVSGPCSPLIATPQWAAVQTLATQIQTLLLSEIAFTKKV